VETSSFSSELIVANWSASTKNLRFGFVSEAVQMPDSTARFDLTVKPGEQLSIPDALSFMRALGTPGIGPKGPTYAGSLFAEAVGSDLSGVALAVRTSAPGGGGRYGLFYAAVPAGAASAQTAWIYGLQQNAENRSNLALVNTGETDSSSNVFRIELFNGSSGQKVNTIEGVILNPKGWMQIGTILAQYAPGVEQGYARVTRTSGANPFLVYGVINDGGQPGQRSDDGAFVASSP